MALVPNAGVGTGGAGLSPNAFVGSGGHGLTPTASTGTGGSSICGSPPGGCIGGIPFITSLTPSSVEAGSGIFFLNITGINLNQVTSITLNGVEVTIFGVSVDGEGNILSWIVQVPAEAVATQGTFEVVLSAPDPGCGDSPPGDFMVTPPVGGGGEAGLRFLIDESYNYDPEATFPAIRVQEAGSRSVYRLILDDQGTQGFGIAPILTRFSPDATKMVIVWDLPDDTKYIARVYDLGTTLASSGSIGDDIFTLDAPVLNERLSDDYSAGSFSWVDCWVNDDGDFWVLEAATVGAPDIFDPQWIGYSLGENTLWGGNIGGGDIPTQLIVLMDSRGVLTTSKTFEIDVNCPDTPASSSLTFNPNEAWWSAAPNPGTGVAGSTLFPSGQKVGATVTVNRTGLPNGAYVDAATDLTVLSVPGGCAVSDAHGLVLPDEVVVDSLTGLGVTTNPLQSIQVIVVTPTEENWILRKQLVGGSLTSVYEQVLATQVYPAAGANTDTVLLDAPTPLISVNGPPNPDTGVRGPVVFDLSVSLAGLAFDQNLEGTIGIAENRGWTNAGVIGVKAHRTREVFDVPANDYTDWHLSLVMSNGGTLSFPRITNTVDNLLPEMQVQWSQNTSIVPHIVLSTTTAGYMVGWSADPTVRVVGPGGDDNELTVAELPGVLNISPGEADATIVRTLDTDTVVPFGDGPRPDIQAVGYGGIPPDPV